MNFTLTPAANEALRHLAPSTRRKVIMAAIDKVIDGIDPEKLPKNAIPVYLLIVELARINEEKKQTAETVETAPGADTQQTTDASEESDSSEAAEVQEESVASETYSPAAAAQTPRAASRCRRRRRRRRK